MTSTPQPLTATSMEEQGISGASGWEESSKILKLVKPIIFITILSTLLSKRLLDMSSHYNPDSFDKSAGSYLMRLP